MKTPLSRLMTISNCVPALSLITLTFYPPTSMDFSMASLHLKCQCLDLWYVGAVTERWPVEIERVRGEQLAHYQKLHLKPDALR